MRPMRDRLRNFGPTMVSKIPKVGESVFAKVGRLLPSGDAEIPLMLQAEPQTMLGTNMVPGEVIELRTSTARRKNKRTFQAGFYVHEVCEDRSAASSSSSPVGGEKGNRVYAGMAPSTYLSKEKQCVHNILGHCDGCLFPRVSYGRQLVEKRRWIQNGWAVDPGKIRPGLQHGSAYTMEWRGYINKGPRGWTGSGWPTECTRVSRRARAAMGAAVDQFPEAHRYHVVQGDAKDVVLVLEGGLAKCTNESVKERMRAVLLRYCDGIMWDGENIGGKKDVSVHLRLDSSEKHARIPTHKVDVATHVYVPGRSVISEVCRTMIDMIPSDVKCAWETGVPPFAVTLSTVCDKVVHFGPHVTALPNARAKAAESAGAEPVDGAEGAAAEGAEGPRAREPVEAAEGADAAEAVEESGDITSLLCDWQQDATLRRLLLLCAKEVEKHADDVPLGQHDVVEEQRAQHLFGEKGLVVLNKEELGGRQLDDKNRERLQKLYRGLAKKYHPDRGGDSERFAELARAYTDLMKDEEGELDSDDEAAEVSGLLHGDALASPVVYADNIDKAPSSLEAPDLVVWTIDSTVKPEKFRAFRTWLRKGLVVKHIIVVYDGTFEFLRKTVLALGHSGYALEDVKAFDSGPHTPSYTILARLRFNPIARDEYTPGQLRLSFRQNRPLAWTKTKRIAG